MSHLDFKDHAGFYAQLFEDTVGAGDDGLSAFYDVIDAAVIFKEHVREQMIDQKYSMGNSIQQNYNQGILLEEGCAADIFSNHIIKNLRANIALGGEGSGSTKIKYNHIEKSKQEGIFIVEGGLELIIASNIIEQNQKDGIVLLHSEGTIQSNKIQENERHGIYLLSDTSAKIESNTIMDNRKHGIDINDPSMPEIKRNKISGNKYNVWLDKNARKKWEQIRINNPEIKGPNYLPQNYLGCNIF